MSRTAADFSKKTNCIKNHLRVDENKYPFLKTLRAFLEKVPEIAVCYLSGSIVQRKITFPINEPIIYLYIISNKVTPYIQTFIQKKAETLVKEHFFPHYIIIEVHFVHPRNLDEHSKFILKCDSAFWFGDKSIHNKLPVYCVHDLPHCNNDLHNCSNCLRQNIKQSKNGSAIWINVYILLNTIIKAIYEKNSDKIHTYHCACADKQRSITEHPDVSIIDKNIVTESYRIIKNVHKYSGKNMDMNKPFLNFVSNYLDFCNKKITYEQLLETDYSVYRNWLQFITTENNNESSGLEDRTDFKFLFNQSNERYLNRISRNQLLMNKLVPSRSPGVNAAGLTPDMMKRLRQGNK